MNLKKIKLPLHNSLVVIDGEQVVAIIYHHAIHEKAMKFG
jgi:hypothetical protein